MKRRNSFSLWKGFESNLRILYLPPPPLPQVKVRGDYGMWEKAWTVEGKVAEQLGLQQADPIQV